MENRKSNWIPGGLGPGGGCEKEILGIKGNLQWCKGGGGGKGGAGVLARPGDVGRRKRDQRTEKHGYTPTCDTHETHGTHMRHT